MPRTTKPLTHTEISQAKPRDKVYKLSDGGGMHLRVNPNGTKTWVLDYYRPYTKVRVNITFGSFPHVSLASACSKRDDARALLAENIDPKERRDEDAAHRRAANQNTLKHVTAQWLEVKKTQVTPEHAQDSWRSLELHVFPSLGALPITKVTAVKAIDTMQPIAA